MVRSHNPACKFWWWMDEKRLLGWSLPVLLKLQRPQAVPILWSLDASSAWLTVKLLVVWCTTAANAVNINDPVTLRNRHFQFDRTDQKLLVHCTTLGSWDWHVMRLTCQYRLSEATFVCRVRINWMGLTVPTQNAKCCARPVQVLQGKVI